MAADNRSGKTLADPSDPKAGASARVVVAARWGIIASLFTQASTIASTVVPARYLSPSDFALVGAATVVFGFFSVFADAGFGQALISGGKATALRISSTFWAATGIGAVIAGLIAATSPVTARLIGTPSAAPFVAVLALMLPLGMAISVLRSVHLRRMNHRTVYVAQILQAIATAVVPIVLVVNGAGPWALIWGQLAGSVTIFVALVALGRVVPSLVFSKEVIAADLRFNTGVLSTNVVAYGSKNLDYWVLGHFVSKSAFGAYYVAFVVPQLLRQRATWLCNQILFPVLARLDPDSQEFRSTYLQAVQFVAALVSPALVGIAVAAPDLVLIAFGAGWEEAVAPLRVLSVAAAIDVVSRTSSSLLLARRESGAVALTQVVRFVVLAAALAAVPITRDIRAAAIAVLFSVVAGSVYTFRLVRVRGIGLGDQIASLRPVLIPTAVMALAAVGSQITLPAGWPAFARLGIVAVVGAAAYVGAGFLLYRCVFARLLRRLGQLAGRR